ncbi:hypothetical protein LJ737_24150 [Hymenobacter sp. 15J16-1T3B]|uniref:hypothetical protein n=1 Tax=Hymenobacter sp. 15J16-1T3B TaxID=2886941 RepID=UPI001D11580A|nr:hypothetical protein [Hymenobacter sp. 15J16-1T3B]MCC3160350.1 hypothetical protein [Hymenobacter sp. 15J16-1T3B]
MTSSLIVLSLAFGLITGLAGWLFYRAAHRSARVLGWLLAFLVLQGAAALAGFFLKTDAFPPRTALLLGPPLLGIGLLFATARGRRFLAGLRPDQLTLLHVVRVPVELTLLGLYLLGSVPRLMTFEGRNWDILAGLSAPLVYYFAFRRPRWGRTALRAWNVLGLATLLNIIVNAVLAIPGPLQQWGFEQPNVAVLQFPFVWLPGVVVPLVLLAHLTVLWQLRAGAVAVSATAAAGAGPAAATTTRPAIAALL